MKCCSHPIAEHRLDRNFLDGHALTSFNIFCRACPGSCAKTDEGELIFSFDDGGTI